MSDFKNNKILFLGASFAQLPIIRYAKESGFYVITVDYLPNNPGHIYSNEYYNISTTDKEEILKLAINLNINAISAYASDPSALTAAYVSDKLGLIGNPYNSVNILSNKILFRGFLKNNFFSYPLFISGSNKEEIIKHFNNKKSVLKPNDSSGSKGVNVIESKVDITKFFDEAIKYSRENKVILEEFIIKKGPQIHGEGFVDNGNLIFLCLGDQVFSPSNPVAPYSTIIPSIAHEDIIPKIQIIIQDIIKKVEFKNGGINVEVIRDSNDEIFVLEIGARNGGNFMPQLVYYYTNFNIVKSNLDILFNKPINLTNRMNNSGYFAQIILHSKYNGVLAKINIPEKLEKNVIEKNIYYSEGDLVRKYKNSKDVVGVIILELQNEKDVKLYQDSLINHNWVKVNKEEEYVVKNLKLQTEFIIDYFKENDSIFVPSLRSRVNIFDYSEKIFKYAEHFYVLRKGRIICFSACYMNYGQESVAFITSISVVKDYQGQGIGNKLLNKIIDLAKNKKIKKIRLEVNSENDKALNFYLNNGFIALRSEEANEDFCLLELIII